MRRPKLAFIILPIIWLMTFSGHLYAQNEELGSPIITNYQTDQYNNASHQNWVAVQDPRGVMYFGNSSCILEFDGHRWQNIPTPGNTIIRYLTCGPDGTIYYGSFGDFGYLAASPSGKVLAVSLKESIPQADRTFKDVGYVLSSRYGIYFLSRNTIFRLVNGEVHSIQCKLAPSQPCLLNDIVFFSEMDKGLCMLDGDRIVPIPQLAGVYNGKFIALAPFGRHELLVGRITGDFLHIDLEPFWDETCKCYDPARQAPKDIVKSFPSELDDFLKENNGYLYRLIPLGADAFAVGTLKGGIVTFDRTGKIIRSINMNNGLLDNAVMNLFVDRTHNLWACNNLGISHIELSVPQSYFDVRNNIRGVITSAHAFAGRMYIGSFLKILVRDPYRFSQQDEKQFFRPLRNSPAEIWQFLEVEGDLMAATSKGLYKILGQDALKVQGSNSYALSLGTSKLWPNHLFVGLWGGLGMDIFKHKTESGLKGAARWEFLGRMADITDNIHMLAEDANGDFWAGTAVEGLLRIHFSGTAPTQAVIDRFGPKHGLPGLLDLRAVSHGTILYVITPKGLFRTTIPLGAAQPPEQIRFTPDTTLGKAFIDPPVSLYAMAFDQEGSAFFSTSEGVYWAIPKKDGQYRMEKRPFLGIPPPDDKLYPHPDGSLWLPGKALYRVDLKAPKDYDQPFTVLVRKVTAKAKRLVFEGTHGRPGSAFGQQRTVFESSQDILDIPELPFRENALAFEFAAAFYEKPGTLQFQYLLEGFDEDWNDWTGETRKEYSYLSEGRYSFRVRAKNIYGTISREAIYSLRILPPWYRTIWAYILWIIVGSAAFFGIIRLYTMKLRRQKAVLEALVAERTQQLREASLTDPLTGLRNRRFIMEVLNRDITTFVNYKNHLLKAHDFRDNSPENTVFGLFLLDIDFFKNVNDTYGHDAGDQVLKQFARILSDSVRLDDIVLRTGGEEFVVVLKKTRPEYLSAFVNKVLNLVAAAPFDLGDSVIIRKTCSIGYVGFPIYPGQPDLLSFDQSIMAADLGMYLAKKQGRNQGVCLEAGPRAPVGEEVQQKAVTSLEFALKEGYLQIGPVVLGPKAD